VFLQFRWTLYVDILRKSHGCWIGLMIATATNGLSVIGGDTVNLVGLGGCLPESASVIVPLVGHFLYFHCRLYGGPPWVLCSWSIAKPDYVARYLHRGVSHSHISSINNTSNRHSTDNTLYFFQYYYRHLNDVPRPWCHPHWYPAHVHYLLATWNPRYLFPAH
jgi:hypothetical protein